MKAFFYYSAIVSEDVNGKDTFKVYGCGIEKSIAKENLLKKIKHFPFVGKFTYEKKMK